MRAGRPTKLTPERQTQIVALIRQGVPSATSARVSGITHATFYRWYDKARDHSPEQPATPEQLAFYEAVIRAREECEALLAAKWRKVVTEGVTRETTVTTTTKDKGGKVTGSKTITTVETVGDGDWRGIAEFLLRRYPETWGRKEGMEVTGAGGGPVTVAPVTTLDNLPTDALKQLLSAMEAQGVEAVSLPANGDALTLPADSYTTVATRRVVWPWAGIEQIKRST